MAEHHEVIPAPLNSGIETMNEGVGVAAMRHRMKTKARAVGSLR